ncbi:MAG: OmpA family protein [Treponema sp.]|nr:OmpA family protein [Treponema sp.]
MIKKRVLRMLAVLSVAFFAVTVPAVSIHADTVAFEDSIQIEMVPREEGTAFRITVPTITFEPSEGNADSERLLVRLVEAFNSFEGYSMLIEEQAGDTPPGAIRIRVPSITFGQEVGDSGDGEPAATEGIGMVLRVMAGIINRFEGHSILIEGHGEPQPIPPGAALRLVVPSIIFGPDAGDFGGIDTGKMESNNRVLGRIAEILNRFEDYSVRIEGHANPTTPPGTALREEEEAGSPYILGLQPLSEERAQTVLEHLVGLGVDRDRLSAVGMGGTKAIVEYEDRDNWWQNRRVEFLLIRE